MIRTSILIPMRNAERYVAATLRSILAQDGFHRDQDEIVIIDDGSTDGSCKVVEDVSRAESAAQCLRVIAGPRQGISAAMNAGIEAALGQFICRCDADDLYPPARLSRQVGWLAEHPDFGAVCGSFSTITPKGRFLADFPCGDLESEITGELLGGQTRTHLCTYLIRADSLRKGGGFRPWFVTAEDIDLQLRLAEVCRVSYQPAVAYLYRLHDASITHQQADAKRIFYEASARSFAAQRRSTGTDDLQRGAPPAPPTPSPDGDRHASAPRSSNDQAQQVLISAAWRQHKKGHRLQALRTGIRACLAGPTSLPAWKSLATLAIKRTSRA